MLARFRNTLLRLRAKFIVRAEQANRDRDDAEPGSYVQGHAAGKAKAYGEASDSVRKAEDEP